MRSDSMEERVNKWKPRKDSVYGFDPRKHMELTSIEKQNLEELIKYEKYEWFVDVAKLVSGDSFGELALLYKEPRAATITCINKCYFATLSKSEFKACLQKIELR